MFIRYGGVDRYINDRSFKVEVGPGHSTYIRLRFVLDRYLSYDEMSRFSGAVEEWQKNCKEQGLELLSVASYPKYFNTVYEIDFDIAKTTVLAIDILFAAVEKFRCSPLIKTANIGYFFNTEWY